MRTATNPETGERFVLEGGAWVPLKTATNPNTGEQVGLIGGEWKPLAGANPTVQPKPEFFGDGFLEGAGAVGSGVAGGLAGIARGLYGSVTGEDYETARAAQDELASKLTYEPKTQDGQEAVAAIGKAFDQPFFNWLGDTAESWGQSTNDYLEETPLAPAAPLAGILASLGPDLAAGAVTGGAGTAGLRIAKSAGGEIADGVKRMKQDSKVAPTLLSEIESRPKAPNQSAGAAEVDTARQNVATAQNLSTPITLTQGQATRNAAQMSDEYNLASSNPDGVADELARLREQQQRDLHQNLDQQEQPRANAMDLNSDEELGRKVKTILEARRQSAREKTKGLYDIAKEEGSMDMPIAIGGLDGAFAKLKQDKFHIHESGKFGTLEKLAEEFGVIGGRPTSINNVEQFRQNINRTLNDITNPNHAAMAKVLKKAVDKSLDDAPDAAAAYKRARAAYARNKTEWDGNALVTQLTGKKGRTQSPSTADEQVYTRIKNAPIADVRRLLRMAAKVPNGVELIHTLGQRVMMDLVKTSQKAGGEFNAQAFKRELDKLDRSGKLEALYGPQKAQKLRDIAEVGETVNTLPYGNSANISQSGNTVLRHVTEILGQVPFMPLITRPMRAGGDLYQKKANSDFNAKKVKKALDIEGLLSYE
jgi:hypothetical protein